MSLLSPHYMIPSLPDAPDGCRMAPRISRGCGGRDRDGFGTYRRPGLIEWPSVTCDHAFTRLNFGIYHGERHATLFSSSHLGLLERTFVIHIQSLISSQLISNLSESLSSKGSSPTVSEADQLRATGSPISHHLGLATGQATMTKPQYRKRPISPSNSQHTIAPITSNEEHQPLFLPDPDEEHSPSTSTRAPLFLPEGAERERPRKKRRRISSKTTQSRTLDDLWHPRQVCGISLICSSVYSLPRKIQPHGQQTSSPSLPGPSNPQPIPSSLSWRPKKHSVQGILGKKPGVF